MTQIRLVAGSLTLIALGVAMYAGTWVLVWLGLVSSGTELNSLSPVLVVLSLSVGGIGAIGLFLAVFFCVAGVQD